MKQEYIDAFLKEGKLVELEFAKLMEPFGPVTPATKEDDMYEHWDLVCTINGLQAKVDVKGLKKINREDAEPNENIHWIEIKNVKGNDGWAWGCANYFAFETNDYFIVVPKDPLQKLVSEKCKLKEKGKGLYKLYTRRDRKDVMTLVKTIDLAFIAETIIKKTTEI
jgi:hypothetical protein